MSSGKKNIQSTMMLAFASLQMKIKPMKTCTGGSKNKYDLVYEGMNVKMVKAFLANKKQKTNGKTSSHVHLRKYNDAILNGAKKAG
jgi:hypothetical protein